MKGFKILAVLGALLLVSGHAFAVDVTSSVTASASVPESCSITSAPADMTFTDYDPAADSTGSTGFEFQCRKNTTFEIFIAGDRTLSDGTDTLNYGLYTDSGYLSAYPASATGTLETATSSAPASRTIYGKIPSGQSTVGVGSYTDSATLTVQY